MFGFQVLPIIDAVSMFVRRGVADKMAVFERLALWIVIGILAGIFPLFFVCRI